MGYAMKRYTYAKHMMVHKGLYPVILEARAQVTITFQKAIAWSGISYPEYVRLCHQFIL